MNKEHTSQTIQESNVCIITYFDDEAIQLWLSQTTFSMFLISSHIILFTHMYSDNTHTTAVLDLTMQSDQSRIWPDLGTQKTEDLGSCFGSQKNTPGKTNGINNAIGCYKEAVYFSSVLPLLCHFLIGLHRI